MTSLHHTLIGKRAWPAILGILCAAATISQAFATPSPAFQAPSSITQSPQRYAGSWQWMFKGKPFATMHLVSSGDHFTGYMTNGFFTNDDAGNMTDAGSQPGQSPITRTFFAGDVLHIVVQSDHDKSLSEWTMRLLDNKKAEFNTADPGAPKSIKPWPAERTSD